MRDITPTECVCVCAQYLPRLKQEVRDTEEKMRRIKEANINMQVADAKSDAHKLARRAKTERRNQREDCTHSYCCCKGGGGGRGSAPLCV
jgi:hypothetical protein